MNSSSPLTLTPFSLFFELFHLSVVYNVEKRRSVMEMTIKNNCKPITQWTSNNDELSAFSPSHFTPGFESCRLLEETATAMEELLIFLVPWVGVDPTEVT